MSEYTPAERQLVAGTSMSPLARALRHILLKALLREYFERDLQNYSFITLKDHSK